MPKEIPMIPRPSTHKELADHFGVSWKTFQKWMVAIEDRVGKRVGNFYTTKQVAIILEVYG